VCAPCRMHGGCDRPSSVQVAPSPPTPPPLSLRRGAHHRHCRPIANRVSCLRPTAAAAAIQRDHRVYHYHEIVVIVCCYYYYYYYFYHQVRSETSKTHKLNSPRQYAGRAFIGVNVKNERTHRRNSFQVVYNSRRDG